jgi:nicotinate phosphoribosyltransferase
VLNTLQRGKGCAVRLDSGDLEALARQARGILDRSGLPEVAVIASGGLDEYRIDRLVRADAPIDVYAVGTKVGTSADAPYLDSAYKLVEYDSMPVMKLSAAKVTAPGRKQILRADGLDDVIALADEAVPDGREDVLQKVMESGRRVAEPDTLAAAHQRFIKDLAALPGDACRIEEPKSPLPATSARLRELTSGVRSHLESDIEERRARGIREQDTSFSHASSAAADPSRPSRGQSERR